ncbi:MAG: C45 family autoproteolytic acyltransferase/hydrolase [Blautia sp.]|nr:C45 family autoproteolytic acyltransferase/hydrolase [Blautia sp.]MCM1201278.1 C45 family autoproteolytic acyltransferase/hydrolase [Bacteroides fragilis]
MRRNIWMVLILLTIFSLTGCSENKAVTEKGEQNMESVDRETDSKETKETNIIPTGEIMELEKGFSAVRYDGDYGFDRFLSEGGASSDQEVVSFLTENLLFGTDIGFNGNIFGCSTIAVRTSDGEFLFGRNFDWNHCNAMAVLSYPENGYASVSTVNLDFISQGGLAGIAMKQDGIKTLAALYAPLDGMNEKGLAVSVNMIQDSATIEQDTEKPDITTTTAIRLLLDKAATVDEALALLEQYDMHASMGMMVHFALADATGKSMAVEYIGNEMIVMETPVLTNFYLAEGEKNGIGTAQSHTRYDMLMERLEESGTMSMEGVRDALSSVSKGNFGEFESTEWSIVFNQTTDQAVYYHRENYEQGYTFTIEQKEGFESS